MYTLQITNQPDRVVEIIKAVGEAWQLVLIIVVSLFILVYKKQLWSFISGFNKVSGKTPIIELSLEKSEELPLGVITEQKESEEELVKETNQIKIPNTEEISFFDVYLELEKGDILKAKNLFNEIQEKEDSPTEKEKNVFWFLYSQYYNGGINTISQIEDKIKNTSNPDIKFVGVKYLGECYLKGKEYSLAEKTFRLAYELTTDEIEKVSIVSNISTCIFESEKKEEAINYLKESVRGFFNKTNKAKIYSKIASYLNKEEDWIEKCLVLELAVANDPNNKTILFEAAYNYSSTSKTNKIVPLSLLHYKELVDYHDDNAGGHNNLGVAYGELDMQNKSVKSYKKSAELNNTLAMANLANKYINQGFFEEAKKLLDEAKNKEDVHENIWAALKKVKEESKNEDDKEKEVMNEAKIIQIFLREFAQQYLDSRLNIHEDFNGIWEYNGEVVQSKQLPNPDYFELVWTDTIQKYTISINVKKSKFFINEGECVKKGGGLTHKTFVFTIIEKDKIRLLVYDKYDLKSYNFILLKQPEPSPLQ